MDRGLLLQHHRQLLPCRTSPGTCLPPVHHHQQSHHVTRSCRSRQLAPPITCTSTISPPDAAGSQPSTSGRVLSGSSTSSSSSNSSSTSTSSSNAGNGIGSSHGNGATLLNSRPTATTQPATPPATGTTHVCVPDDFRLPPGELSHVNREGLNLPADVFRCFGCTQEACQTASGCAATPWRYQPDGYLREILTARVYDAAIQTPLEEARKLNAAIGGGNRVLLKREDLQPVFSFKLRGAFNKMAKLSKEVLARGVITSSAGNHAQGVALAAMKMGCKATICMPVSTPEIKINSVRAMGGIVELQGESYQETQAYAVQRAAADNLAFVPPYDDPYTIAGQGTIGDEILRQISDPDSLDAIFVPIGGGGLIAGIAAYVKALKPNVQIIGVEPTGANAMAISLSRGERITLAKVDAFADGVAVKQVGQETFRICRALVDGVVLVDNSAISAAIKDVFNETRSILEPAGALSVAGAKAWIKRYNHTNKTVVAVTSGANINFERLRLVAELANVGSLTEATMATTIPECPGAFRALIDAALGDSGISITELKYRYSAGSSAQVLWGAGIREPKELTALLGRMQAAGMPTVDISGLEVAQLHLRHLVGGRARSYMGRVPHERIIQVIFPERSGALKRFLDVVSPQWNVTLFHYRNTGNRESSVLMGLQVPPDEQTRFESSIAELQSEFTFNELGGQVRDVFDMFIQ